MSGGVIKGGSMLIRAPGGVRKPQHHLQTLQQFVSNNFESIFVHRRGRRLDLMNSTYVGMQQCGKASMEARNLLLEVTVDP